MTWWHLAACKGVDPRLFFPERGESTAPAVACCAMCPVRSECLEDAMNTREVHGIRGGLSERQRRRLRPGYLRSIPCKGCDRVLQTRVPRFCDECIVARRREQSRLSAQERFARQRVS